MGGPQANPAGVPLCCVVCCMVGSERTKHAVCNSWVFLSPGDPLSGEGSCGARRGDAPVFLGAPRPCGRVCLCKKHNFHAKIPNWESPESCLLTGYKNLPCSSFRVSMCAPVETTSSGRTPRVQYKENTRIRAAGLHASDDSDFPQEEADWEDNH